MLRNVAVAPNKLKTTENKSCFFSANQVAACRPQHTQDDSTTLYRTPSSFARLVHTTTVHTNTRLCGPQIIGRKQTQVGQVGSPAISMEIELKKPSILTPPNSKITPQQKSTPLISATPPTYITPVVLQNAQKAHGNCSVNCSLYTHMTDLVGANRDQNTLIYIGDTCSTTTPPYLSPTPRPCHSFTINH